MKRYIFFIAAALLAAVSCSKIYDATPVTQEQTIGFGTWTETLTKAITDPRTAGTNTFGVGDSFAAYGYKEASSTKTTVFDDVAVEMTATSPATWTYTPPRYWDMNADRYVFYAISPSSVGTGGTVDPQTGEITSASIVFSGKNNDILVADKKTVAKANFNTDVILDFNHAASLVDFKVAKAPSLKDATVTVTAFTLGNIQTTGVMSVNDAYNSTVYGGSTGPVVTWSSTNTGSYTTTDGVTSVTLPQAIAEDDAFPVPAEPGDGKSTFIINNLVVKPQSFTEPTAAERTDPASAATAQKLTITYTIEVTNGGTNTYTSTLFLYDFDIVNDKAQDDTAVASWDTGKHYVFYITLDSNPIVFGATINDWTAGTAGYHYLVN